MRKFPRIFHRRWIIRNVLYITATLQYQRAQAFSSQFFSGPAPADARANDDGVKAVRRTVIRRTGAFFDGIYVKVTHVDS